MTKRRTPGTLGPTAPSGRAGAPHPLGSHSHDTNLDGRHAGVAEGFSRPWGVRSPRRVRLSRCSGPALGHP